MWKELIPANTFSRLIMKEVEDYVSMNKEEESAVVNKVMQEEPFYLAVEQWMNNLCHQIQMMEANKIKTLVELAERVKLMVTRDSKM